MRGFLKKLNFFVQPEQSNNVQIPIKTEDMQPMKEYNQEQPNTTQPKIEKPPNNMPQGDNKLMPSVNECNNTQKSISTTNENKETKKEEDRQIVIVNNGPIVNKKEGFYYKKHIESIQKLTMSQPIMIQRESMKVGFDKDVLEYLFNDMTTVFKEKSNIIDQNQKELIEQINQTHEFITVLYELNRKTDESLTNHNKQVDLMNQIDYLDLYINSLSVQADQLLEEINLIEKKMNNKEEQKPIPTNN